MFRTETYELEPTPFWSVVDSIEEALAGNCPTYAVSSASRDEPVLTKDTDRPYAIMAKEEETYGLIDQLYRGPHEIRFTVPRTREVERFGMSHGMTGSWLGRLAVGTRNAEVDPVIYDIYDRLGQET